jgi:hypothetical protein
LQRERTALKVMTELLVERRDTLRINDLIGVAALFEPLVLRGELPDRAQLKQQFRAARELYLKKLRPLLLRLNEITEEQAAGHSQFQLDDKLIKTVLLGALVPEVPALHNLTAGKLHALNFGTITSPIPGYEHQIVLNRLNKVANEAGELSLSDGPDPVVTLKLHTVDYDQVLELINENEAANSGARQQLLRELVSAEIGLSGGVGQLGELLHNRDWRGRRHVIQVTFGNVRDETSMPVAALLPTGDAWRVVIDYPFDPQDRPRSDDRSRIGDLPRGERSVFWLPFYFSDQMMGHLTQLAKINFLLGGTGERYRNLVANWSDNDRQQGRLYFQQRQSQLRNTLANALKQAYGVAAPQSGDVVEDGVGVLHVLEDALQIGDPRGGTLADAFHNLTGELLAWAYPGKPALPEDEKPPTRAELTKILGYAKQAAADPSRGTTVAPADQRTVRRICNNLQLGELAEHRYVLTTSTSYWTRHLLQRAAVDGYREHFPVNKLREYLDDPEARGFDRELQNLIICVFALDQELAWYASSDGFGRKVTVDSVAAVTDGHELRHPPMPDESNWKRAVATGQRLFGLMLPAWRTPANLGPLAAAVREAAGQRGPAVSQLADLLGRHATELGLDPDAATGRLATAHRLAALLTELRYERDDVVLVNQLAGADLGDIDVAAASEAISSAPKVVAALAETQWPLVTAVAARVDSDESARTLVDQLRAAARHEQHATDLADELKRGVASAAALLAALRPDPDPVVDPPPVVTPPVVVVNPPGVSDPPDGKTGVVRQWTVADEAGLKAVVEEITAELTGGRRVRITWEFE